MAQGGVIKGESAGAGVSLTSVFSLSDIARQAEQVLAAAQEKGRRLLADAQAQSKALAAAARRTGHEAGHAAGFAEGRAAGHAEALAAAKARFDEEAGSLKAALTTLLAELETRKLAILADATGDQLALAHAIAEKVTRLRVQLDGEAAKANLEAAVRHCGDASNVTVLVSPADLEAAEVFAADLAARIEGLSTIDVRADAAVSRGGCLVKHGAGRIDATIETQLSLIARQLLGVKTAGAEGNA
jgi:flagellar assembly protein FliH